VFDAHGACIFAGDAAKIQATTESPHERRDSLAQDTKGSHQEASGGKQILLINRGARAVTKMKETVDMSDSVGSVTQIQAAVQAEAVRAKAPESRPQPVPVDEVQLSSAAEAALRETVETPAQTAKEAGSGDTQAKLLLAKEELAKEAAAKTEATSTVHVVA
jgi:hypothetical protein